MSGRKRARTGGVGYAHNTNLTITPAAVVSNARPRVKDSATLAASNADPLFPHQQVKHPKYLPARKGGIAFGIVCPEDAALKSIAGPILEFSSYSKIGSYDPELDSIHYFAYLNSMGDGSSALAQADTASAQKNFLKCIRPLGIIISDVENATNLNDLGNTLMHSFGKMTIPNLGDQDIEQGCSVSADIVTTRDYKNYGISKMDNIEPDCYMLVPVPTRSNDTTVDFVRQQLKDGFRSATHEKAIMKLVRGCMAISAPIFAHIANLYNFDKTKTNNSFTGIPGKASESVAQTQGTLLSIFGGALLSIDDESDRDFLENVDTVKQTLNSQPGAQNNSSVYSTQHLLPVFDITTSFNLSGILRNVSSSPQTMTAQLGQSFLNNTSVLDIFNESFDIDRGIFDLVAGLSDTVAISQSFKIGMAVTPASPTRDFDLVVDIR